MFFRIARRFPLAHSLGSALVQNEGAVKARCHLLTILKQDVTDRIKPTVLAQTICYNTNYIKFNTVTKTPNYHKACKCWKSNEGPSFISITRAISTTTRKHGKEDQIPKIKDNTKISQDEKAESSIEEVKSKGLMQRFKDAYKEYGKALIGVHAVTSVAWFGGFFYAAHLGVDVVPILEYIGASEKVISAFTVPGVGNIAVAYLLYKVATPARYPVTIVGTQMTVKLMRRWGFWEPPEDSLRQLVKDGRQQAKDRVEHMREEVKDKYTDIREDVKEKYSEWKDKSQEDLKGKLTDLRQQKFENTPLGRKLRERSSKLNNVNTHSNKPKSEKSER